MCTVLLLLRPGHRWPLIAGANRDERIGRAFLPPGRHWPGAPRVLAGKDVAGGGSWFGVNDDGVVATIVNGMDRLGPLPGKASRGDLVLRALGAASASVAAATIGALPAARYRGFTLIVADRESAFAVHSDEREIAVAPLAPGHHMATPDGYDVVTSPRYAAHFPAFAAAAPPEPERGDWSAWEELLRRVDDDDPHRAMTVVTPHDFGTVCSGLVAVAAEHGALPYVRFANGPPTRAPYEPVQGEPCVSGA
jgi:hypothetical protein